MHRYQLILAGLLGFILCNASRAEDAILHANIERTDANLFIPGGVKVIRGVLINPADKSVGPGTVWGECCRHWGMAHLGLMLENVDKRNNRPNTLRKVIEASLKEFAEKSGHPELINAPFLFGGMSKGGGWSAELGQGYASRTIAFNNVCGWVGKPDANLSMPAVIVIGGIPDGFKMLDAIPTQYEPARKKGALWGLAIQWGNAHNYGNANSLAFPFLDAIIAARIPANAKPFDGPVRLADIDPKAGWLGDRTTWESNNATIAPYADYRGEKELASWLPNRYTAHVWRSFVSKDPPVQLGAATQDGKLALPVFKPTEKRFLLVPKGAPLKLSAQMRPDAKVRKVAFYDGDILLGEKADAPFELLWQRIPPGPRSIFIEYTRPDGSICFSNPALIVGLP